MTLIFAKFKTIYKLGISNVLRVLWFRLGIRLGLNPVKRLKGELPRGCFFRDTKIAKNIGNSYRYSPIGFGYIEVDGMRLPDWHVNLFTAKRFPNPEQPWHKIPDFATDLGDIKGVWELSRFDWVLGFAREYREGNTAALSKVETWLADWIKSNPPYCGPNWKCGQEASIRVMHLAMAAIVLDQAKDPQEPLLQLVKIHLQRISPTISYAIAQDNNHGTSEAAALFIGGSWLERHGFLKGQVWRRKGRKGLENRARHLIEDDGSFSQYSVNYHRVMLDTFCMAEVWRQALEVPEFSRQWYRKATAATEWLKAMLQPGGHVPNIGANDGARLLPLSDTDYRDFRPSVQLASTLFCQKRAISEPGEWDSPLRLLGVELPKAVASPPASIQFSYGGYTILRNSECCAVFRYPCFRFRPGQSDVLHLDFWLGNKNVLRDGGTYSYNAEEPWQSYFPGVRSHNTIQFDGRDQMPRFSRFLFGDWLRASELQPMAETSEGLTVQAGYHDYKGATHIRKIELGTNSLSIEDEINGFKHSAVLRWRMEPGDWRLEGLNIIKGDISVSISTSMPVQRCELVEGWESLYYGHKTPIPVFEIEVDEAGCLSTEITWSSF